MKPDLDSMYSELHLSPSCSLAEFQRAYRKQIAELHPDRNGGPQSAEKKAALRELIWVYATVNRFHRRYGRMPGGHSSKGRGDAPTRTGDHEIVPYDSDSSGYKQPGQPTLTVVVLFIALLILLALELADNG